jgi:hypothetical protein
LRACPGVVEEQQERPVSQGEPAVVRQAAEELFDFISFEEACLWRGHPLHRDGGYLLAGGEHLW